MTRKQKITAVSLAIAGVIGLTGCGGGGGGSASTGSGATTSSVSTTSGVISGFGSVFVDGVEFETDNSRFSLDDGDDGPEHEAALAVGMVVTITGTVNDDGKTGSATHIEFDDELEGIVNAGSIAADGTGTLTVMGQTVVVKDTTVFESKVAGITSIDLVVPGNVIEVSGFSSGDGTVYATRIEVKLAAHAGEEIEVKGIISSLTATTFDLGGLRVDYSTAAFDDDIPDSTLSEGLYVEVKSTAGFNGAGDLVASEVELEDDGDMGLDGEDGDEVDLNGVVTAVLSESDFEIDGNKVIITSTTEIEHGNSSDIRIGIYLEVEGRLNSEGDLVADEIELGIDDDIEMAGNLEDVNNPVGTITLFGRTIQVGSSALKVDRQDEEGLVPEHFFDLEDLSIGDFVEIDAYADPDSGDLVAVKLERDDADGDENELQGPVEAVPNADTLVIAGITVDISALLTAAPAVTEEAKVVGSYSSGTLVFTATGMETDDD